MFAPEHPTPHFLAYGTLASPVVCATADPSGKGRHGVGIYVQGAGTVVIRPRGGASAGTDDRTLTAVAGLNLTGNSGIEFDQLVSGTATNVVVFWGRQD